MEIYPTRTAASTILFFEKMIEEMRFPTQSIQTDRGKEFFAYKTQEWLREYCIKFCPIRPRQPHLNGKVERAQQTDLKEFWALIDFSEDHLGDRLSEYQHYYNWDRVHGSLGKTPMDAAVELSRQTPFWDEGQLTRQALSVHGVTSFQEISSKRMVPCLNTVCLDCRLASITIIIIPAYRRQLWKESRNVHVG